jgi:hypothetical protein
MRTELHFNLPEEEPELKAALKGAEYLSRLMDIDNYARGLIKHGNIPEEFEKKLEEIRDLVGDIWDY